MPSLPTPGSDNGTWGTKLNEFLQVAHSATGEVQGVNAVTGLAATLTNKASLINGTVPVNQLPPVYFDGLSGTGATGNPYYLNSAVFKNYLQSLPGWTEGKVLRGDMVWVVPPTATTPAPAPAPTVTEQNVPIGYAMVAGTTTGGAGGTTTTVSTYSALVSALSSNAAKTVYFSGKITYSGAGGTGANMIDVGNNTTLIGINGATLNGYGLAMWGRNNIIIKNMKINKVLGSDCIRIKQLSHHIWIDHCELWQDRTLDTSWEYYDELLEVVDRSSYVTISNCFFNDSHKAVLIGSGSPNDVGYLKVTMYNNYFLNCSERQPKITYGHLHTFNNYHLHTSGYDNGYGIGCPQGATVRTDNNYFENQNIPILTDFSGEGAAGTVSGVNTNIFVGGGSNPGGGRNVISTAPSNWLPPYSYSTYVIPAANVPAYVLANAGVK